MPHLGFENNIKYGEMQECHPQTSHLTLMLAFANITKLRLLSKPSYRLANKTKLREKERKPGRFQTKA